MRARAAMENLLVMTGYKVHVEPTKWDPYCRIVARVTSEQAGDLGLELVQQGMAYGFYLDDAIRGKPEISVAYGLAESNARNQKRGLWPMWLGPRRHVALARRKARSQLGERYVAGLRAVVC